MVSSIIHLISALDFFFATNDDVIKISNDNINVVFTSD